MKIKIVFMVKFIIKNKPDLLEVSGGYRNLKSLFGSGRDMDKLAAFG